MDWQDAGEALDHPDLSGCYMPRGIPQQVQVDGAYLQYNEVSGLSLFVESGHRASCIFLVHRLRHFTNSDPLFVDGED